MPRLTSRASAVTPLALVRLDPALIDRIRRGEGLGGIALSALGAIALGGAAYGGVFGLWRAPAAALGSALKLPLVFLGVVAFTTLASGLLAPVLRSGLSTAQASVAALLSFTTTAAVLGALSPVGALVVLSLPPLDARAVGLAATDALAAPSVATAQALVLGHTAVIAAAGIAGVLRLLTLLERLGDRRAIARRVVLAWITVQFLVGAELSWRLRPFLGAPNAEVRFLAPDAFEGSFFEEIARLGVARFGAGAPLVLGLVCVVIAGWLVASLRSAPETATAQVDPAGLVVAVGPGAPQLIPWPRVRGASIAGHAVRVTLTADAALEERELSVRCGNAGAATALCARIERARTAAAGGPFRTCAD